MSMWEPICYIECDKCGTKDSYEMPAMAEDDLWSSSGARSFFEDLGWVINKDGESFCEDCCRREV